MKQKIIKVALALTIIALFIVAGCKKEEFPSKTVKVSQPTITLVGPPVVILHVGDTYTDQGATYYDSLYRDNGTLSTTTVVNTSEEGFFIVTYSATNQYGFEGSGTRLVAVTGASDSLDVSGAYFHAARGGTANVSKVGRGVFVTDNVSGGAAGSSPAYFMFTSDSSMIMPCQFLANNGVSACFSDVSYDFTASPPNYSYAIAAAGFGTSARVFEKQ
jgi:hypothetical protein